MPILSLWTDMGKAPHMQGWAKGGGSFAGMREKPLDTSQQFHHIYEKRMIARSTTAKGTIMHICEYFTHESFNTSFSSICKLENAWFSEILGVESPASHCTPLPMYQGRCIILRSWSAWNEEYDTCNTRSIVFNHNALCGPLFLFTSRFGAQCYLSTCSIYESMKIFGSPIIVHKRDCMQ